MGKTCRGPEHRVDSDPACGIYLCTPSTTVRPMSGVSISLWLFSCCMMNAVLGQNKNHSLKSCFVIPNKK